MLPTHANLESESLLFPCSPHHDTFEEIFSWEHLGGPESSESVGDVKRGVICLVDDFFRKQLIQMVHEWKWKAKSIEVYMRMAENQTFVQWSQTCRIIITTSLIALVLSQFYKSHDLLIYASRIPQQIYQICIFSCARDRFSDFSITLCPRPTNTREDDFSCDGFKNSASDERVRETRKRQRFFFWCGFLSRMIPLIDCLWMEAICFAGDDSSSSRYFSTHFDEALGCGGFFLAAPDGHSSESKSLGGLI